MGLKLLHATSWPFKILQDKSVFYKPHLLVKRKQNKSCSRDESAQELKTFLELFDSSN